MRITILFFFLIFSFTAQSQIITTIAGGATYGYSGDSGPATAAELNDPIDVKIDAAGNKYICEYQNHCIRKITPSGIIRTIAGNGTSGSGGDGGPATAALLNFPSGLAIDRYGNIYIADEFNYCIRKINTSGIISTVAGNGFYGYSGDGGAATDASITNVNMVAVDTAGNLFLTFPNSVRKVDKLGMISTIVGDGASPTPRGDGGPATDARVGKTVGITVDLIGNIYITDEATVRKIDPSGIITTIAGTGTFAHGGDGGPATAADINFPFGIALDAPGNIYVSESDGNTIRKISPSGIISTYAGDGVFAYLGDSAPATAASMLGGLGMTTDNTGALYFATGSQVRKIDGNAAPYFISGTSEAVTLCENATVSIDAMLAASDADAGQTETWSMITKPAHGALISPYVTLSTGGTLTPAGLSYVPDAGYSGVDSFKIFVSDYWNLSDSMTVYVTINPLPDAGTISGIDSVCGYGGSVTLSNPATGGTWSCDNSNATISGSIVTGVTPGTDTIYYTVINSCGTAVASFPMNVVICEMAVNDPHVQQNISIYPNPANDILHINSSYNSAYRVTNIMGAVVCEGVLNAGANSIPVNTLKKGIYFLQTSSKNEKNTTRFLKE